MFAIIGGQWKTAEYLIEQAADVNCRSKAGQTALMLAAQDSHKRIVEQLIGAGADVRAVDKEDQRGVVGGVPRDFPEVISILVMFKANPDVRNAQRGITPLMAASLMGYANSVGLLLTLGANEKIKFRGRTAYQMASAKGQTEVCRTMKAVLKHRPPARLLDLSDRLGRPSDHDRK